MNRLARKVTVLGTCAAVMLAAGAAFAGLCLPDESKSTLGSNWPNPAWRKWLVVEGYTTATVTGGGARIPDRPDMPPSQSYFGDYEVTINDCRGIAARGVSVCIDFSGCSDVRLSCDQLTAETGQVIPTRTAKFTFKVQGAGKAERESGQLTTPGSPADTTAAGCATITANTTPFSQRLKVTVYDVNGSGSPAEAVSGADAALIALEATRTPAFNPAYARSDYNHDGQTTGADAAASATMATQASASTETGSRVTGPYCP